MEEKTWLRTGIAWLPKFLAEGVIATDNVGRVILQ